MAEDHTPLFYPPVAFSFRVNVGVDESEDINFQEVSGISVKLGTFSFREGGENQYEHRLPEPPKYENLILKRGMVRNSKLINWARQALEQFKFSPVDVTVRLLDEKNNPLATWSFTRAYPVALKVSEFKGQENAIVIETLELSYDYFVRQS